jgi:hypothetical protein
MSAEGARCVAEEFMSPFQGLTNSSLNLTRGVAPGYFISRLQRESWSPPSRSGYCPASEGVKIWSAPAERSGDGALDGRSYLIFESKAVSRYACHRTPKQPVATAPGTDFTNTRPSCGCALPYGRATAPCKRRPAQSRAGHSMAVQLMMALTIKASLTECRLRRPALVARVVLAPRP